MRSAVPSLLVALLFPTLALAQADARFSALKARAEAYDGSLFSFLEKYVGDCSDPMTAAECRKTAAEFRQKADGHAYVFTVGEEQANLSPGRTGADGSLSIYLTPFFPAGNLAVCEGTPRKMDANGHPLFSLMTMKGKAPEGWDAERVMRQVTTRQVRLQVVFTPQGVWTLNRRGQSAMQGVRARIDGVLATAGSTGETLATYVGR